MDYAPFIYANLSKTAFHKLELIQNKCLRRINGAYRSTPVAALQVELGELPLQYRFKLLNIVYSLKCINAYAHPAHDVFDIPLTTVYPTTSLSEIYQEYVHQINIPVLGFRIPPQPPWHFPRINIDTNLRFEIAKDTPGYISKATALEFISRWPMHLSIYTDGSKVEEKVAFGIYVPYTNVKISCRLNDHLTIYTAELFAIHKAVLWIIDYAPDRAVIFTDSLSSLTSLENHHSCNRPYLILEIMSSFQAINSLGLDVWLVWVPAHVGITGNEVADGLARDAINSITPDISIPLSLTEIRPVITSYIMRLWQVYWSTIEVAHFYKALVPLVSKSIKFCDSNRSLEVALTRLRFNHNKLNFNLHRTGGHITSLCDLCQVDETAQHYFFECFRYIQYQLDCYIGHAERDIPFTLDNLLGGNSVSTILAHEYIVKTCRFSFLPNA